MCRISSVIRRTSTGSTSIFPSIRRGRRTNRHTARLRNPARHIPEGDPGYAHRPPQRQTDPHPAGGPPDTTRALEVVRESHPPVCAQLGIQHVVERRWRVDIQLPSVPASAVIPGRRASMNASNTSFMTVPTKCDTQFFHITSIPLVNLQNYRQCQHRNRYPKNKPDITLREFKK